MAVCSDYNECFDKFSYFGYFGCNDYNDCVVSPVITIKKVIQSVTILLKVSNVSVITIIIGGSL